MNGSQYSNPALDQLLEQAQHDRESSSQHAPAILYKIQETVTTDLPVILLYYR